MSDIAQADMKIDARYLALMMHRDKERKREMWGKGQEGERKLFYKYS